MNTDTKIKMIKAFSNAFGPSGKEDDVVSLARSYVEDDYDVKEDHLRNLYITSKNNSNNKPLFLLDAHSDEVGLIVQAILDNGTLAFLPLGGWVAASLPTSKVRILNKEGKFISGIVASKPPHFMSASDKNNVLQISDMVIDIGATNKKEVEEIFKIGIGSFACPDVDCTYDEDKDLFLGKAFDCRIGCAAVLATLDALKKEDLEVDVIATLSSQEEVGERGMELVCKSIAPDIAIVFEGCPADDTFQPSYMIQSALKKGPMLRHFDRSMITNPRYQKFALDLANDKGIPVQESVRRGGGPKRAMLHVSNNGTPSIVIGNPVRYIHSHHGFCSYEDFDNAVKLAVEIVKTMNQNVLDTF